MIAVEDHVTDLQITTGTLEIQSEMPDRVLFLDSAGNTRSSTVSSLTLSFVDPTSSIQTQLDGKASTAHEVSHQTGGSDALDVELAGDIDIFIP